MTPSVELPLVSKSKTPNCGFGDPGRRRTFVGTLIGSKFKNTLFNWIEIRSRPSLCVTLIGSQFKNVLCDWIKIANFECCLVAPWGDQVTNDDIAYEALHCTQSGFHSKLNSMRGKGGVHFRMDGRVLCTSTEWKLRKARDGFLCDFGEGMRTSAMSPEWKLRPENTFLEDLPENTVDDGSLLAYATVMDMGVAGTCGDESTIKMCALAVVISKPAVLGTRAHRMHRLLRSTPRALVLNVAARLKPNWARRCTDNNVARAGEGKRGTRDCQREGCEERKEPASC